MCPITPEVQPLGAICDTNSKGRFDLILYEDGLLAVKGTYTGVALRGAGVGAVGLGGGGGLGVGAAAGLGAGVGAGVGRSYEGRRLGKVLGHPRAEILTQNPKNFFVDRSSITGVLLRKRWHGCSLTITTQAQPGGRVFSWKPALNNFSYIKSVAAAAFGDILHID